MSTLATLRSASAIAPYRSADHPPIPMTTPAELVSTLGSRAPLVVGPWEPPRTAPIRLDVRHRPGQGAKRAVDIVAGVLLLILLAPVMLAIAIAVKRSSPGPVFFLQERIGRDGRTFKVIKFRSMRTGTHAEVMGDAVACRRYQENGFKLDASDPRITGVGRFIRATSLDELPQLFNVVRGDMSLVGIRPLLADELELRDDYDRACYTALRPGMTGLWQVSGRSSTTVVDRYELDRRYIDDWSFANDLLVLVRTPLAVLRTGDTR